MPNDERSERDRLSDELSASDVAFIRALEDLIHVLIDKQVINITDLPEPVRDKLDRRRDLRKRLAGIVDTPGDDDNDLFFP